MGQNTMIGKRGSAVLAVAALTVAGVVSAGSPAIGSAEAAGAVDYFKSQGCGVRYRAGKISTYSSTKKPSYAKALNDWKFDDLGGEQIQPPVKWTKVAQSKADRSKLHSLQFLDRLYGIADERRLDSTDPFSAEDERLALDHAVAIAADWSRAAAKGAVGSDAWKQRIAGIRAPYLVYGARKASCEGTLSEDDAAAIKKVVGRHASILAAKPSKFTPENHKFSINTGLATLGTYFPKDPGVRGKADVAGQRFVATISKGYNPREGTWLEQSPRYQLLSYRLLANYLDRIDPESRPVKEVADALLSTLGLFLRPDNRLVMWGDTSGEEFTDGDLLGARRNDWWVAFESGVGIYSDDDSWFGAAAQYHARQHKQADELTFDLWENGLDIIRDSGFFHKDNDQFGRFQATARAHSVLTVDDRDFDFKLFQHPYGSGIQAGGEGDGWYAVRGTNPLLIAPRELTRQQKAHSNSFQAKVRRQLKAAARFDAEHVRTWLYKPGEALIVADRVRSERPHTYRRYFQFGPEMEVSANGPATLDLSSGALTGKMLTGSSVPAFETTLNEGQDSPTLGYVFPEEGQKAARTTATVKTDAQDLDQVSGIFYGKDAFRFASIASYGSLEGDQTIEISDAQGNILFSLAITRAERTLTVDER